MDPGSENITVLVRIRPSLNSEAGTESCVSTEADGRTVTTQKNRAQNSLYFDRVIDTCMDQATVFESAKPSVEAVLEGFNATIFAYGQTGTGKTYTMMGLDADVMENAGVSCASFDPITMGIIPRSMEHLFYTLNNTTKHYTCTCSYLEIYNEKIFDLLDYHPSTKGLDIREDRSTDGQGMFVPDATHCEVGCIEDVFKLMLVGAQNRATSTTDMNEHSSRSHTIFSMVVCQKEVDSHGMQVVKRGKLNLVDLAGSEKWRTHTQMGDRRIKELTAINQSLSALGNCISALTQHDRAHIPFRDSKLTRLLQDSLGGNCKTTFIATISPSVLSYDETCSTLKFADRAKHVVMHTKVNESYDDAVMIQRLMQENERLRRENMRLHTGQTPVNSGRANARCQQPLDKLDFNSFENLAPLSPCTYKAISNSAAMSEYDSQLQRYHRWVESLQSLELSDHGTDDQSLDSLGVGERIAMMEHSVVHQARELQKTKELFVSDLRNAQAQVESKNGMLGIAETNARLLKFRLNEAVGHMRSHAVPVPDILEDVEDIAKVAQHFDELSELKSELATSIASACTEFSSKAHSSAKHFERAQQHRDAVLMVEEQLEDFTPAFLELHQAEMERQAVLRHKNEMDGESDASNQLCGQLHVVVGSLKRLILTTVTGLEEVRTCKSLEASYQCFLRALQGLGTELQSVSKQLPSVKPVEQLQAQSVQETPKQEETEEESLQKHVQALISQEMQVIKGQVAAGQIKMCDLSNEPSEALVAQALMEVHHYPNSSPPAVHQQRSYSPDAASPVPENNYAPRAPSPLHTQSQKPYSPTTAEAVPEFLMELSLSSSPRANYQIAAAAEQVQPKDLESQVSCLQSRTAKQAAQVAKLQAELEQSIQSHDSSGQLPTQQQVEQVDQLWDRTAGKIVTSGSNFVTGLPLHRMDACSTVRTVDRLEESSTRMPPPPPNQQPPAHQPLAVSPIITSPAQKILADRERIVFQDDSLSIGLSITSPTVA